MTTTLIFQPIFQPVFQDLATPRPWGRWSPTLLFAAGEQGAWYDPADMTTLFQDAAGTTPVTAADQPVGLIRDKSGRGNDASQVTAGNRPILRTGSGLWWIEFDGVDDFLVTGSINFSTTDKLSVFSGVRKFSDAASGAIVGLGSNVNLNAFELTSPNTPSTTDAGLRMSGTGSAVRRTLSVPVNTSCVVTGLGDLAGATIDNEVAIRANGVVSVVAATGAASSGNLGNSPMYIGRRSGATLPYSGNIYGLIVRGVATDAAGISAAENYLAGKSGVAI